MTIPTSPIPALKKGDYAILVGNGIEGNTSRIVKCLRRVEDDETWVMPVSEKVPEALPNPLTGAFFRSSYEGLLWEVEFLDKLPFSVRYGSGPGPQKEDHVLPSPPWLADAKLIALPAAQVDALLKHSRLPGA